MSPVRQLRRVERMRGRHAQLARHPLHERLQARTAVVIDDPPILLDAVDQHGRGEYPTAVIRRVHRDRLLPEQAPPGAEQTAGGWGQLRIGPVIERYHDRMEPDRPWARGSLAARIVRTENLEVRPWRRLDRFVLPTRDPGGARSVGIAAVGRSDERVPDVAWLRDARCRSSDADRRDGRIHWRVIR